ncbi:hypothetical protein [Variovorax sp. EL159]|uniref:hypothetical protein n=1 Tax=Variovorax sp. EL159 TaxID=1566270 RepID=UPI00116001DF|nr:hypothetical protein [Variovorax sp. EL159]
MKNSSSLLLARAAIERVSAMEPCAFQHRGISVEEAMKARDVQLQEALAALRSAADDASAAVVALLHVVKPKIRLQPAPPAGGDACRKTGFITLAQELRDVTFQLRVLETSVGAVAHLSREGIV